MKFETYLLLALLVFGIWKTNRSVQRSRTVQERFFTVRASIFFWFVGFLGLTALLLLPVRALILLLLPVAFGGLTLVKFFRDVRSRLRQTDEERVDIERMKRIN
ncbi:hypothetical protein CfE428DRAFT_1472 [Chthoniobacter flavus Ellin428]|uniref:Uncharacterized protein n=1 Tax=Chthoniobacter flavus Ellin428 TaxID=497964 RepID=B4CY31_9BACT|nr:hypothetical protein [Chthoniobacter flavus]EDY21179.1 hypothetical protein CfE428DRAFT_1472 [Chthoniobacter flavus Ellin428]TCO87550.1 hypothetical protein EV701_12152 [Chthoniobacter flavus]